MNLSPHCESIYNNNKHLSPQVNPTIILNTELCVFKLLSRVFDEYLASSYCCCPSLYFWLAGVTSTTADRQVG